MRLLTLLTGFVFLFAVPRGLSPFYETVLVSFAFAASLYMAVRYYLEGYGELAIMSFVIAVFYNPVFVLTIEPDRSPVLDAAAGLLFFIVALFWSKIVRNSPKLNDHVKD